MGVLCISLTKIQFFRCVPISTVYICSVYIARDILDKLEYKLGYGAESKKKRKNYLATYLVIHFPYFDD